MAPIRRAGREIFAALPEDFRAATLFTVDAVVDSATRPWLLDVNPDPVVHPLVYPAMVASMVALERRPSPGAAQPAPAGRPLHDVGRASSTSER